MTTAASSAFRGCAGDLLTPSRWRERSARVRDVGETGVRHATGRADNNKIFGDTFQTPDNRFSPFLGLLTTEFRLVGHVVDLHFHKQAKPLVVSEIQGWWCSETDF